MYKFLLPTIFDNLVHLEKEALHKERWAGVSVYEDQNAVIVEADVPGVKPEELQIVFDKGGIAIEGKVSEEKTDVTYYIKSKAHYSYWVPLPPNKISENAKPEAVCTHGVLKLTFPKMQTAQPYKIAVKVG